MDYQWSILEVSAKEGIISHAKYKVIGTEDGKSIETEGNWWFKLQKDTPFDQITEEMVAKWIEEETTENNVNLIKSRLKEQLDYLNEHQPVIAPWLPQVFTPNL